MIPEYTKKNEEVSDGSRARDSGSLKGGREELSSPFRPVSRLGERGETAEDRIRTSQCPVDAARRSREIGRGRRPGGICLGGGEVMKEGRRDVSLSLIGE